MRTLRMLSAVLLLCVSLHAVPKFFYVRTFGTPDGAVYDSQRNLIYVSSPQTSQVLAVAADSGQVQNSVYIPNAAGLDITHDRTRIVVGTTAFGGWYGNSFLTFVDLDSFTVAERIPISNPLRLDPGGQWGVNSPYIRRVVALYNGNILFTVSPPDSTETWIGLYDQTDHTFSLIAPQGKFLIPSEDRRYVLLPGMGLNAGLQLFDAEAGAITAINPALDGTGAALSRDGKLAAYYVDQHSTLILNAATLQPILTIATPTAGWGLAFSPDNRKLYVQKFAEPGFYVFNVSTGLIEGAITVPGDDHNSVRLLGMDSRSMLYSSLNRGLAVTDSTAIGFFEPQSIGTSYPYAANPSAGPISGGTAVTLGVYYKVRPTVFFSDKIATITSTDSNGIHVVSPPGERIGPVDVTIKYDDGAVAYIPEGFSYGPAIEYLDRTGGSTSGGDSLTLFALGLRSTSTAGVQVQIGGAPATINSISTISISPMKSPTYRIKLTTPSGRVGPASVVLTTQDGSAVLNEGFNYLAITNLGGASTISHMLYDNIRGHLYRCNYAMNRVEVVNPVTGSLIRQYLTHISPAGLALSPDNSRLYVTTDEGFVEVVELETGMQRSIQVPLPPEMQMTRTGQTSKGTLFVGIHNPNVIYDSRLIEVDPGNGSFTTRLSRFNGNYVEIGLSRDGTRAFISSDLAGGSGNTLYYWDSFTDSFREQHVPGWGDYGVDDRASLLIGGGLTYDPAFNIHNTFETFDFDAYSEGFVWGEKLDDSGALAIRPAVKSLVIYDVHGGNRIARIALPTQTLLTLDAMAFDSAHSVAYISSAAGLLRVPLPNLFAVGRIEPTQGLTTGGQKIFVRGIGFQPNAEVRIGGEPAATVFVNATTLEVTAPAMPLGPATVQVINGDGRIYSLPGGYAAVDTQPIIAGTSPSILRTTMAGSYQGVSIIGMNFSSGAVALWNGSPRSTYFVNDTQLRFDLNSGDTLASGNALLTVRNPDGGLSNQITVPIKDYPQVSLPTSFWFPAQVVNTPSAIQTSTVTNSGKDAVALSFSAPNPFTLTSTCPATIAAGASCTLSVSFTPTAPGTFTAGITVSGDITSNIDLRGVAGLAFAALSAAPSELKFPPIVINSGADGTVILTNVGIPNVTVNKVFTDSSAFSSISYAGPTLITGQTGLVSVSFHGTTVGPQNGHLVIDSTAGRVTVPLTGTVAEQLGFDTAALSIPALKGQITASKVAVNFKNSGGFGVSLAGVSISGYSTKVAFSQTNNCPAVLNGNSSCTINVSYVPSGAASDAAELRVLTSSVAYSLPLTGALTDFSLVSSTPTATVSAGQTATFVISVDASAGYRGNLAFTCSGMPSHSTCTVIPGTITAGDVLPSGLNVTVATTARESGSLLWPVTEYLAFAVLSIGCVLLTKSGKAKITLPILALIVTSLSSCGSGGGGGVTPPTTGTPAGTYTLTVTATTPFGGSRQLPLALKVN